MLRNASDPVLSQQLNAARAKANEPLSRADVTAIVTSVINSMGGEITQHDLKLYSELEGLARFINNAKREIADIQPSDIHSQHIPLATDELDAVVGATEDATNRIMDACDQVMALAGDVPPDVSGKLMDITTGIYEACNFQDITGQRITKVVRALKHIEQKVEALLVALGEEVQRRNPKAGPIVPDKSGIEGDAKLLNGPSMPGAGIDQAFIDSLFD
jgi:chemotaxis protein CheZ